MCESGWRVVVVLGGWCRFGALGSFQAGGQCFCLLFPGVGGEIKAFIAVHRHVAGGFTEIAFNGWTFATRVAELATLRADWLLIVMNYPTPFVGDLQ